MNPGVAAQHTGDLPQDRAVSTKVATMAGSVAEVPMTSTRGITGAGLKKWNPAKRRACFIPPASAVTDSDEVLVVKMVPSPTIASR